MSESTDTTKDESDGVSLSDLKQKTVDVSDMDEEESNELVDEMLSVASDVDLSAEDVETDEEQGLESLPRKKREALEDALEERDQIAEKEGGADSTTVRVQQDTDTEPEDVMMDEIEDYDFESQEWTLGQEKEKAVKDLNGTKFLLSEPDDDELINSIEGTSGQDRSAQLKAWTQMVVDKPNLSDERWESMTSSERLALATMCAEYVGIADFIEL